MRLFIFSILLTVSSPKLLSQSLTIQFDNIRNNKGVIDVSLYESEDTWLDDEFKYNNFLFSKINVNDNQLLVTIDHLKPGKYAVAILDDEDANAKMHRNFIGFPQEGYGFSNNAKPRFSKPRFKECAFDVKNDTAIFISIQYR